MNTYEIDILCDVKMTQEIMKKMEIFDFELNQRHMVSECMELVSISTNDLELVTFWRYNLSNIDIMVDIKKLLCGTIIDRTTYGFGNKLYLSGSEVIENYLDNVFPNKKRGHDLSFMDNMSANELSVAMGNYLVDRKTYKDFATYSQKKVIGVNDFCFRMGETVLDKNNNKVVVITNTIIDKHGNPYVFGSNGNKYYPSELYRYAN